MRVEVDVSKPLCKGRRVILADDEEVWVSFNYEKLPNFCNWCGVVWSAMMTRTMTFGYQVKGRSQLIRRSLALG